MTETKIETKVATPKVEPKAEPKVKKEVIEPELIKDMADKIGHLWQTMNEHADALNEMRKKLDQVRTRMGL